MNNVFAISAFSQTKPLKRAYDLNFIYILIKSKSLTPFHFVTIPLFHAIFISLIRSFIRGVCLTMASKKKIAIIMGSLTDYQILKDAENCLNDLKISYHTEVVSAHRTPEKMVDFAKSAHEKGFEVIIAGAGGAAHLPGMVASLTPLPVIGVPVTVGKLKGLDALLSIAQMPKGIPVATVAVDNAHNAALLAARILAIHDKNLMKKVLSLFEKNKTKVKKMNSTLRASSKARKS